MLGILVHVQAPLDSMVNNESIGTFQHVIILSQHVFLVKRLIFLLHDSHNCSISFGFFRLELADRNDSVAAERARRDPSALIVDADARIEVHS